MMVSDKETISIKDLSIFHGLMNAVIQTAQGVNVVGCDVNELSPVYDPSGVSTAVAGKIIREFLLALQV